MRALSGFSNYIEKLFSVSLFLCSTVLSQLQRCQAEGTIIIITTIAGSVSSDKI